ncbi:MAG: molybdopterin-binding protein [Pirellulaceae bacterium]
MFAEIIAIGDELTSGQRLDTNSQWLSQRLGELGVSTRIHTTVGDDLAANIEVLKIAANRADIVVCTGGLGPTLDDLTRQALADAFDRELILDEVSLAHIRALFASRNREMPERNISQAMFPAGSQPIVNPHGSAPGIDFCVPRQTTDATSRIFALPGVPAEMQQMWHQTVAPEIERMLGAKLPLYYHSVKVFGIGESDVEVKLPELIHRERLPTVGITVSRATITLRVAGRAANATEFNTLITPTLTEIKTALGDLIFGEGDDELEHCVLRELKSQGKALACIEIGAASWISNWLLAADTHTKDTHFVGGVSLPDISSAQRWLTNRSDAGQATGDPFWRELATQACSRFQTQASLVVGIYPSLSQMEAATHAFEFVFASLVDGRFTLDRRSMGGHPDVLCPRAAKTGLDLLRRELVK